MREIVSVTGPVEPEALGFCQCHEHLVLRKGESFRHNPALCLDDLDKSLEEARRYRAAGGVSLAEAQPVGCGRDARWLHDISVGSGVGILASTGFHKLMFYPADHWLHRISAEDLTRLFLEELTEGMYLDGDGAARPRERTPWRAGLVKTAFDTEGLTPRYVRLFRAAAQAAQEADRVLMIHVENGTDPLPLLRQLLDWGVEPGRLMFCHMDRACADLALHRAVLEAGAWLEYDTIGRFKYHSDAREIEILRAMLDAGYADRILYSLDTTRARLKSYAADAVGLDYILTVFNPLLREAGVPETVIRKLSTDNPRRLFSGGA